MTLTICIDCQRSLPQLLVASLASQAELQNSVKSRQKRGVNVVDGMQISKKFVSTRGWQAFATLTVRHVL